MAQRRIKKESKLAQVEGSQDRIARNMKFSGTVKNTWNIKFSSGPKLQRLSGQSNPGDTKFCKNAGRKEGREEAVMRMMRETVRCEVNMD